MRHDRFAERAAERLEAVATAIEDEDRRARGATVSVRANEMRVAAFMVKDMAEALKREENLLAEMCDGDNETRSGTDHEKKRWSLRKSLRCFDRRDVAARFGHNVQYGRAGYSLLVRVLAR